MNRYRCETCTYKGRRRGTQGGVVIDCNKYDLELNSFGDQELINCIGCASHSDFQSGWVLEQFVALITEEMVYDDGDMYYKVNPDKYVELLNKFWQEDE